mmetsp:Transcript_349/g.684  ORF Transcript_349/g.684 Transcript_349/m.684 type:complete len:264 (-) Transcript_349:1624-2415(-)
MPVARDESVAGSTWGASLSSCASFKHPRNSERIVSIMLDCRSSSSSVARFGISLPCALGCASSRRRSSAISSAKARRLPELSRTWERAISSPPSLPSTGVVQTLELDSIAPGWPTLPVSEFSPDSKALEEGSRTMFCLSLRLPPCELSLRDDFLLSSTGSPRSEPEPDRSAILTCCWELAREMRRRTVFPGGPPGVFAEEPSEADSCPLSLVMHALHSSGMLQLEAAFWSWRSMFGERLAVASLALSVYAYTRSCRRMHTDKA